DADTLRELRDVRELRIRTGKHPTTAVVIWIVVADDEVFVRSWLGARGRWYRDLAGGGPATLEFSGRRIEVQAFPASDDAPIARASAESCGNTSQARMRGRWCARRSSRPRCGSNRADTHRHPGNTRRQRRRMDEEDQRRATTAIGSCRAGEAHAHRSPR